MSKEFIEAQYNRSSVEKAAIQEEQLTYFISSELQENRLNDTVINNWINRNNQSDNYFINWIKTIFKPENSLLFSKYLRFPLPSARIVKNRIAPQLKRVFNAEDQDFRYSVSNVDTSDFIADLNIKDFNSDIFERILYKHNSLLVTDLESELINTPKRYYLDIEKVYSITEKNDKIDRIAYEGCINHEGVELEGYIYIDSERYAFYNSDKELVTEAFHDLGFTPVNFISPNKVNFDFVVRESLFTYVREEIEEYTFLKTLQRMTEPNGAIPVITKINADADEMENNTTEPNADAIMGSQKPEFYNENKTSSTGIHQPGTVYDIDLEDITSVDGTINTDPVVNYINYHYMPIEALTYLNDRIEAVEKSIIVTVVGDFLESNETAKNELQIDKSISALDNTLNSLASALNRIRKASDYEMLSLKYGKERVKSVFIHYGTDFFLETQTQLFEDLEKAPNTLERKSIIVRINKNRYKNNPDFIIRTELLYDLMPYVSDKDFEQAISNNAIDEITKQYQLRFNYWITQFEALYGDIVDFYMNTEADKAKKLTLINNLILEIIKKAMVTEPTEQ